MSAAAPAGDARAAAQPAPLLAPLLALAGVHTHIGAYHILHGVDLEVPARQITLLLGRNGAGKTTTLRTIMGLWSASAGQVRFDGQDVTATCHAGDRRRPASPTCRRTWASSRT